MATEPQHLKNDGSTRCTVCGAFTLHFEGCAADPGDPHTWAGPAPEMPRGPNGEPPPFESFPSLNHDWEDGEDHRMTPLSESQARARQDATIALVLFVLVLAAAVWFPIVEAWVDAAPDYYAPAQVTR